MGHGISVFLDRPIAFHRAFLGLGLGVKSALFLSQCVYWSTRTKDPDGWFYKSQAEWEEETGLTRGEQEGVRQQLRRHGYLHERKAGVPCRLYFRLDNDALWRDLSISADKDAGNQQSSMRETSILGCGKPADKDAGNQQAITEITAKSTAKNTEELLVPSAADDTTRRPKNAYPEAFERAWQAYPTRAGGNNKAEAFKAWKARIKAGVSADDIHAGVLRYAAFVRASGKIGTEYVKQAATFFGPAEHWREPWADAAPNPSAGRWVV